MYGLSSMEMRSVFVYPLSFDEFLVAMSETNLVKLKKQATPQQPLPEPFHNKLIDYLKRFLVVGGMPEAVARYAQNRSLLEVQAVLDDLLISVQAVSSPSPRRLRTPIWCRSKKRFSCW